MLNLDELIKQSLKQRDDVAVKVFRAIKTEKQNLITAPKAKPYTDLIEIKMLNKIRKQRLDSIEQYNNAGRIDLADQEKLELDFLETLLPKTPTVEEIRNCINEVISTFDNLSMKSMGIIIKSVQEKLPTAPGIIVSAEVKSALSNI